MNPQVLMSLPGISPEEILFIQEATKDLQENQENNFLMVYNTKRKDPQTIMICTIIGFIAVAGIQRFMLNQIGMGILYLLTGGLCLIGTIVDLINYQKLTLEHNQKMVVETLQIVKGMR